MAASREVSCSSKMAARTGNVASARPITSAKRAAVFAARRSFIACTRTGGHRLPGLAGNEFVEPRHAQANRHRRAALVLPIPAMDALPGGDQGAARLRTGGLLVEHQIAGMRAFLAGRPLGMAVELRIKC